MVTMADVSQEESFTPIKINEISGLWSYFASIDWSEPWFTGLGIFHVACALLTILTRKTGILQAVYFGILMLFVLCAEQINTWAAANWQLFASQQYFDSNGLFISMVFSVPLLINCLVIVVCWLFDVGILISEVKRLKYRIRKTTSSTAGQGDIAEEKDEGSESRSEEDKKEK